MANELFDQDNKSDEVEGFQLGEEKKPEPQMSAKPEAKVSKNGKKKGKPLSTQDKLVFGAAIAVGLGAILWVAMPSSSDNGQAQGSRALPASNQANNPADQQTIGADFQTQISEILMKQKQQQDKDRADYQQGMQILSQQLKVANSRVDQLGQQINELRMNGATTSSATGGTNSAQFSYAEKALRGFSINDISQELAWVKYKGQLYAVKQGSQIGNVIVTRIDASNRIVYTNEGVIH